jgi:hypothetical protein
MILGRRDRRPRLLQQLHRLLVHAQHWVLGIVRGSVGVEHFLHPRYELGVRLRRDHPVFQLALGHPVFLSVRRTVS